MAATAQDTDEDRPITVHRTSPGRTVFTESNNSDGWIATDYAVDLER
jgi:hypothetical protein